MVNWAMVNAGPSCSERADFCIIFAVSGRFLHFKNPFKYMKRFEINHDTVHLLRPSKAACLYLLLNINVLDDV
jgi:hypothetical protein